MPARSSSLFLMACPNLPARTLSASITTYSSLGMVKLSRTSFGFFTLAGLSTLTGLVGFGDAALVGALAAGFTAAFFTGVFLSAGFLAAGALVAGDLRATVVVVFFAVAFAWAFLFHEMNKQFIRLIKKHLLSYKSYICHKLKGPGCFLPRGSF